MTDEFCLMLVCVQHWNQRRSQRGTWVRVLLAIMARVDSRRRHFFTLTLVCRGRIIHGATYFEDIQGHFYCVKSFYLRASGNVACNSYDYVYTLTRKRTFLTCLVTSAVLSKPKDFSKSQAVTYTVKWYYLRNGAK